MLSLSLRPLALAGALALAPLCAFAQTAGNASVAVVSVDRGEVMGANGIDDLISANLAGRLGLAILAHEWMEQTQTDPATPLEGGDPGLTIGVALSHLLEDGRAGEMARALLAARIGYTPLLLDSAVEALFAEAGIQSRGLDVQRGAWGGPEWTGAISARDTARLGVLLARLHDLGQTPIVAGAGLQCIAIETGSATQTPWVGVVSGAVSPEGCMAAARSAIGLTDTRLAEAERVDRDPSPSTPDTDSLGLPEAR